MVKGWGQVRASFRCGGSCGVVSAKGLVVCPHVSKVGKGARPPLGCGGASSEEMCGGVFFKSTQWAHDVSGKASFSAELSPVDSP